MTCNSPPAQVVYDRVTDRSRGFAFVTLASADEAWAAIRMFDGSVSLLLPPPPAPAIAGGGEFYGVLLWICGSNLGGGR